MKRLRTIGLILIAVIAFLAVAAALVALLVPETDLLRKNVEEQLTRLTGQNVALGSVKLSWAFPRLVHISLKNVSIRTRDGEQLLSADKVTCSPALISLIQGKVIIESISLERFQAEVRRLANGQIRLPLIPLPGAAQPLAAPDQQLGPGEAAPKQTVEPSRIEDLSGPRLTVMEVSLSEGRIDWVDTYVKPGSETTIAVRDIKGKVTRTHAGQGLAFNLFAKAGDAKPGDNEIRVEGSVPLTPEQLSSQQGQVSASTDLLDLTPFSAYIPQQVAVVRKMVINAVRVQLAWGKGFTPVFSYETELWEPAQKGGRVRLRGHVALSADFSSWREASVEAQTDSFPLKALAEALPPGLPLDAQSGFFKGRVEGKWSQAKDWRVTGDVELKEAVPKPPFLVLGKPLSLSVTAELTPKVLVIRGVEIAESTKIASFRGKVTEPFSQKPALDFNGEITANPRWLQASGVRLPDSLRIGGSFPVRGTVNGRPDDLGFDVAGDLTGVPIEWQPHLNKPRGQKGSISAKGRWLPTGGKANGPVRLDAVTRLELAGVGLRLAPQAGPLQPASLNLVARVLVDGKKIHARDGTLGLRKGSESRDFLTIKGSVTDIAAADPVIDAQATTTVSNELVVLAGFDSSRGVSVKGSASLAAGFSGPLSRLSWHLELPIDHLDVSVGNRFRKPGDVAGSVKASGKLVAGEMTLDQGQLTLPGATMTGRGLVRDRNGNPGPLKFDLRKGEVDKLLRYFPEVIHKGFSGPVEASLILTPSDKRLIPIAVVRPIAVSYRPDKADWSLERLSGRLDIKDDSLVIAEIVGSIAGAVESPLKVTGELKAVTSTETANGTISVALGKGRIKADRVQAVLQAVLVLVGPLLDPEFGKKRGDVLGFSSLTGDFRISSGTVSTDNISFKGSDLTAGGVGSLRLDSLLLDLVVGLHTEVAGGSAIGKIPGVGDFLKKHQEVLKATGLDKELKRWGITPPDRTEAPADSSGATRTPVTVFVKVRGPLSSPQVSPVLETAVEKNVLSRLRSLIH